MGLVEGVLGCYIAQNGRTHLLAFSHRAVLGPRLKSGVDSGCLVLFPVTLQFVLTFRSNTGEVWTALCAFRDGDSGGCCTQRAVWGQQR